MSFAKVQRTYEQLDEFALATEVNAMVEGPFEGKPVLVAIFKKDFALKLRKRTWIKIDAYDVCQVTPINGRGMTSGGWKTKESHQEAGA